ncbi:MAG: porphobilinogen synthase [Dorea sp.]
MIKRPRRLRSNETLRQMIQETRVNKSSLIYPMFVRDGKSIREEILSMPGQYRYTVDQMFYELEEISKAGVSSVMLFGIPEQKDELASQAYAEDGVVQRALREAKMRFPNLYYITDVCLCEYMSHGHCGVLSDYNRNSCEVGCGLESCGSEGYYVDNDATLTLLAKTALSHVQAGADMVAPSDMMDGRVAAIRSTLDAAGLVNTPIMSYAVKYASGFYAPFRDAAESAPAFGDRKTYQMDYHNSREAVKEALLDEEEGADILMVKPAMAYLDIIAKVKEMTNLPVAAYSVSGEYAMIKAAAEKGWIEEDKIVCETALAAYRAGAQSYLTYFAKDLARYMDEGRI